MKKLLWILGRLAIVSFLFLASAMVYSTMKGHTTWYFRVNGQVSVDGRQTSGYMHANTQRSILLLTRTDGSKPETYLVPLRDKKPIFDCGEWHPMRFLPFPIGDVNPPCSMLNVDPAKIVDAPVGGSLVLGRTSVQFLTASGKKVKADW